jgi:amino acid adenylation domain-containing protein
MTYGQFAEQVCLLGGALRERYGAQPGDVVGVLLPRGSDLIVVTAAVMAAGAAYLVLDPSDPVARVELLVVRAGAKLVITSDSLALERRRQPFATATVEGLLAMSRGTMGDVAIPRWPGRALAYVTFTSGSSGAPKPVMVTREGLNNLVEWYRDYYAVSPNDRVTQIARPTFDAYALEAWTCLGSGATLCIAPEGVLESAHDFIAWLDEVRATVCFVPTALAEEVIEADWPRTSALRAMLVGGSRLQRHPSRPLPFRLYNNYGPTEVTVVTACAEVSGTPAAGDLSRPPAIGTPIPGLHVHVLGDGDQPVSDGSVGELCVGGVGLALGYRNDPGETSRRFVPDGHCGDGSRMYRTGDLVVTEGEKLHFLGRLDEQVKVHGHRIEPAEVEAALLGCSSVRDACVVGHRREAGVADRLVAYVVPRGNAIDPSALRAELTQVLPKHLVPSVVESIPQLPLTTHGKVDRRALEQRSLPQHQPLDAKRSDVDDVDTLLRRIWTETLRIEASDDRDDFFDCGGDSLHVVRLVGKARRSGLRLKPEDVHRNPVLGDLISAVRASIV